MIRLKRFDDRRCICGHSIRVSAERSPVVAIVHVENREVGMLGVRQSEFGERPYQLIQSRTCAIQEISKNERDNRPNSPNPDMQQIASALRITFGPCGNGFRFSESTKFIPKSTKVFLRPGKFQLGIGQ